MTIFMNYCRNCGNPAPCGCTEPMPEAGARVERRYQKNVMDAWDQMDRAEMRDFRARKAAIERSARKRL